MKIIVLTKQVPSVEHLGFNAETKTIVREGKSRMQETRSSGSVEGVISNSHSYSDSETAEGARRARD